MNDLPRSPHEALGNQLGRELETLIAPSAEKQAQRAELIQVLAEAMVDGSVGMIILTDFGTVDITDPGMLEQVFDAMVEDDNVAYWPHFSEIRALPAVIKLYRRLT